MRLITGQFKSSPVWRAFALMIAAPALALALFGLRAARTERIEMRQKMIEQQRQSAHLADASISAALDDIEHELRRAESEILLSGEGPLASSAIKVFTVNRSRAISFPRERVFFSQSGERPGGDALEWSPAVDQVAEQAQAAEIARPQQAVSCYRRLSSIEPRLREWAEMRIAWVEYQAGKSSRLADPVWAESEDRGPMGSPVALLACAQANVIEVDKREHFVGLMERSLERLRIGKWWLSYDERRSYDAMIRGMLESAGRQMSADDRLEELAAIERLISNLSLLPGDAAKCLFESTERGAFLIVLQPAGDGVWKGAALSSAAIATLMDERLGPILNGQDWRAVIRNTSGVVLWGEATGDSRDLRSESLRVVNGWEVVFAEAGAGWIDRRMAMWGGFIAALVVMLAAGLALTARVVRREKELAEMQNEFIAAVSHEFKSPITSIRLLVERFAGGRASLDQSNEYRDALDREIGRLERQVNHLLDARQLQEGRRQYTFA
ncbi:MAG TPA: histidine kinase dimerization/phospho-acceptor domain-containing protein, partial [Blastocatellia bacterium]